MRKRPRHLAALSRPSRSSDESARALSASGVIGPRQLAQPSFVLRVYAAAHRCSMAALLGDASCGPVNPLATLSKTFQRDRSLQQVRQSALSLAHSAHTVHRTVLEPMLDRPSLSVVDTRKSMVADQPCRASARPHVRARDKARMRRDSSADGRRRRSMCGRCSMRSTRSMRRRACRRGRATLRRWTSVRRRVRCHNGRATSPPSSRRS